MFVVTEAPGAMVSGIVESRSYGVKYQVHVIQYADGGSDVTCEGIYAHPQEIWDLAACPYDARLFSTVYSPSGEHAAIWRLPGKGGAHAGHAPALEQVGHISTSSSAAFRSVLWHPAGKQGQVAVIDDAASLHLWDFVTGAKSVTAGDDGRVRFWDMRNTASFTAELAAHSYWAWRARVSPFKERLVLVAASARSPAPQRADDDHLLQAYTEHEDSVYSVAWSARDPWVFASLSYDGRVIVDTIYPAIRKRFQK
eukprot:jgi/Mesen1/7101/ME000369S06423